MVFVLKYRKSLLLSKVPLEYFKQLLESIGERYWFKFDAIGIEGNHFHVVVGAAPRHAPSDIMRTIKSITAKMIFKRFKEIKKELWGGEFWSEGGHIDTVSEYGGLEKIKKYVKEQGKTEEQLKLLGFN